jgi:hypothetical protein
VGKGGGTGKCGVVSYSPWVSALINLRGSAGELNPGQRSSV